MDNICTNINCVMTKKELRERWLDESNPKIRFRYYADLRSAEGRPISWSSKLFMKLGLL